MFRICNTSNRASIRKCYKGCVAFSSSRHTHVSWIVVLMLVDSHWIYAKDEIETSNVTYDIRLMWSYTSIVIHLIYEITRVSLR